MVLDMVGLKRLNSSSVLGDLGSCHAYELQQFALFKTQVMHFNLHFCET